MGAAIKRVAFLIDGFNLYHSVNSARKSVGVSTKWLDMKSLCDSYLPEFGRDAQTQSVHWFTAIAYYLNDTEKIKRHKLYIRCLRDTGVTVHEEARFKKKDAFCRNCQSYTKIPEEKETDVAIAAKLLEVLVEDSTDAVALMTGDTDIAPAVKTALRLFPEKQISFLLPYGRPNKELKKLVSLSIDIKAERYVAHQLPDPYRLKSGKDIAKPSSW